MIEEEEGRVPTIGDNCYISDDVKIKVGNNVKIRMNCIDIEDIKDNVIFVIDNK
ncbi:hypothetical protein WHY35_02585 [Clostridium perfringens]|uniref:hypothetical protein n=1 Tax=Clostridium perfringens TaxID=1502 RepID=UPI001C86C2C7|nr:hypothetical protein [Clostridium perfringens]MDM0692001.1 hypothetical protein [Clostridium perfringens]